MIGYAIVAGTRPEAIKLAPLVLALRSAGAPVWLIATGQHGNLFDVALGAFGLVANEDLAVMHDGQTPAEVVARLLPRLVDRLAQHRPAAVIVQGDTASAFAGAQAAAYCRLPLVHVEAGLRTHDAEPFPEEMHRRVIAQLADVHCAPTLTAAAALRREGIADTAIHITGNTGIDALLWMARRLAERGPPPELPMFDPAQPLIVATIHRRENHDRIAAIAAALTMLADDAEILLPVHPHPAIQGPLRAALAGRRGIHLVEPLPYPAFVAALTRANLVLTDSGGIQEEAPALGLPVLVLRDVTERPEGIAAGNARLVGHEPAAIVAAARAILSGLSGVVEAALPYGAGNAATSIATLLCRAYPIRDASAETAHQGQELREAGGDRPGVVDGDRGAAA